MTTEVKNIWNDFHKELRSFIVKKVHNQSDADDILQDVFVKIIRNSDKVNQADNIRHYFYGIVKNTINDYFRNNQRTISLEDIPELTNTEIPEFLSHEETNSLNTTISECCVKPFINKLPDNYKNALLISEFEGVSQKELARKLNISYSGAKSRVQRGKQQLKKLILDCCAYESDVYGNLIEPESKNCDC